MRIQKLLASVGIGSRRKVEEMIKDGLVTVNGHKIELGFTVDSNDLVIKVSGKKINYNTVFATKLLMYNKPIGQICSHAKSDNSIYNFLPKIKHGKWISIGRLDLNSSGLLLITNDGELAHKLMHPSSNLKRTYLIRTFGKITEAMRKKIIAGITIDQIQYKFANIRIINDEKENAWYEVDLMQGKNKEIRTVLKHFSIQVNRLQRIKYGPYKMPKTLASGKWKEIEL